MDVPALDKLEELLPGIEDFLVRVLPAESLSRDAEQRRQYFAERLDILKLPPTLPPRAGKRISVELLQETEKNSGIPAELVPEATELESEIEKDFAAKQREISRNLLASVSTDKEDEGNDSDSSKGVKVYDDIDPSERVNISRRTSTKNEDGKEEDDEDDINALYEIPIARQNPPPTSEDSLSQPADISSLATAGSVDDINDDVLDTSSPATTPFQPPPLPPRTKKSESESRHSVNSLEGKPPELPFRPPLPRRSEIYARSERSDKSEKSEKSDVSDGDSTSYESFDEDQDSELRSKLNIKLPKRSKKKNKTSSKLLSSKARSSCTWEINVPFKKLDNVQLSGDLQHKGKLTWNRRLVAISNGCLALYKPDKEGRPVFVIPLTGYHATLGERDAKKGFEIKLTHKDGDSHLLTADFKEWASIWCDQINAASQGLPVPSFPQHLARTFSGGSENSAYGSKVDFNLGENDDKFEEGDYEIYEEYATDSTSVFDTPPPTPQVSRTDLPGMRSPASMGRLTSRQNPNSEPYGLGSPASTGRLSLRPSASSPASSEPSGVGRPAASDKITLRSTKSSESPGLRSPTTLSRLTHRLRSRSEDTSQRTPATLSRLTQRLLNPRSDESSRRSASSGGRMNSRQLINTDVSGSKPTSRLPARQSPKGDYSDLNSASASRLTSQLTTCSEDHELNTAPCAKRDTSSRETPDPDKPGLKSPASTSRLTPILRRSDKPAMPQNRPLSIHSRTASSLTLSRWDWKTLFYNWSFPLDQIVLGLRRGNLSNSNSNLSISSDGVESDDSSKPVRLRGTKVMRMGSFAYRATQFFENLGKKSTSKRKTSGLGHSGDKEHNVKDGIQEESSLSSGSIGLPAVSPSSDLSSPVFADGSSMFPSSLSSPTSPTSSETLPSPAEVIVVNNIKHQGYLSIFSSFNKRRWGQRWCLVRENMFECYKNKTSYPCELNFLLKNCVLRQALAETNSPLAIMLLENNREKITVEPPNKDELGQWLRVLMVETATEAVPEGLEEYFVDTGDDISDNQTTEAEYTDIMGASIIKSWEVGSAPVMSSQDKARDSTSDAQDQGSSAAAARSDDQTSEDIVPDKYLYTEVVKKPSTSNLEEVLAEEEEEEEEEEEGDTDKSGDGSEGREKSDKGEKKEKERVPRFTDNLAVYNSNKNTTDSGFYSVKEANSDSESGSELRSEEASPREENAEGKRKGEGVEGVSSSPPPPPLPSSSPPPVPVSSPPPLRSSSPVEESPSSQCNTGISETSARENPTSTESADGGRKSVEDDEEESVLERTMTADDFSENKGDENAASVSSPSQKQSDVMGASDVKENDVSGGCEESKDVKGHSDKNSSECVGGVPSDSTAVATNAAGAAEDTQQQPKSKKKKKKSKNKKNKKQQSQEESQEQKTANGPVSEQNGGSSVTGDKQSAATVSHKHSDKVNQKTDSGKTSNVAENPNSSSVNTNSTPAVLPQASSREGNPSSGDANPSPDHSANALEGPEENETITELRERLGRLREKLIQIKRKRIAVRDKRVRVFTPEERAACDKEYLVLEAECKETAATIQNVEQELKMALEAFGQS